MLSMFYDNGWFEKKLVWTNICLLILRGWPYVSFTNHWLNFKMALATFFKISFSCMRPSYWVMPALHQVFLMIPVVSIHLSIAIIRQPLNRPDLNSHTHRYAWGWGYNIKRDICLVNLNQFTPFLENPVSNLMQFFYVDLHPKKCKISCPHSLTLIHKHRPTHLIYLHIFSKG